MAFQIKLIQQWFCYIEEKRARMRFTEHLKEEKQVSQRAAFKWTTLSYCIILKEVHTLLLEVFLVVFIILCCWFSCICLIHFDCCISVCSTKLKDFT